MEFWRVSLGNAPRKRQPPRGYLRKEERKNVNKCAIWELNPGHPEYESDALQTELMALVAWLSFFLRVCSSVANCSSLAETKGLEPLTLRLTAVCSTIELYPPNTPDGYCPHYLQCDRLATRLPVPESIM